MGPKKDPKDAKKKEIIVDGKNLAAMTDEQLLEFQKDYTAHLLSNEKENTLLEMELNMLRNAWKMAEDKVSEVELENVMIRREQDMAREKVNPTQWDRKDGEFDKRVMYDRIKERLVTLDEGPDNIIDLGEEAYSSTEDAESFYHSKPSETEGKFEADKRHIQKDRRLRSKKRKFDGKIKELRDIQEEMEEALAEEHGASLKNVQSSKVIDQPLTLTPSTTPHGPLSEKTLEQIALEEGTISTGSVSDETEHPVMDQSNMIDDSLAGRPKSKKKHLDPEKRVIKNLTLLKERKWKRSDPRYDDIDECDSKVSVDSDQDHIFDDYNPFLDEEVNDDVHFNQMRKWLEYDYDTLVEEMRKRTDRRIKAINYVWTKDVKNVLCDQLRAVERYDQKLRETVRLKIDQEVERTRKNEEHLKLLIQGLEEVRIKMIKERYATNMCIAKQQTEELNYLIQESYDRTINELKASNMFNFNLTQIFFMRSTENDISLVHELHSEQKRVEDNVKMLRAEVEGAKKELVKLEGPLEEEERMAKWMETTIAALQKDMRSKKDQERTNSQMVKDIVKMEASTTKMQLENTMISLKLAGLENNYDEIKSFKEKYNSDNPFNMRMRQMRENNEGKIVNLRNKLRDEFSVTAPHLKMIGAKVDRDVVRCKLKRSHNLLETKAFNELVTQFDLRAREHQMKAYVGIDKLAIPYRKTSANIITTFNEKKKVVFPYNTSSRKE
ncbi:hypothetical protein GE061_006841 [Apolygus lucorum]|uniref:Uncharacterized protein n=1 Tax=Apolygus lucorum TaxID=248454 RepID=A0A8S9WRR4_APOLU|nr:hypothetical protein GE061_006841 [Apolygus lucorum]